MTDHPATPGARAPEGSGRRIGILTTDERLEIVSWDDALASMTGIAAADAVGRLLTEVVPDLDARGLTAILRDALETGAAKMLAPALHRYLIPAPAIGGSPRYDRMQQGAAIAPLVENGRSVGLAITIEDVTARLDMEHQLAGELRHASPAVRRRAIERLREHRPVHGLGPLPSAMADDDWQVRRSAVEALAGRRDPELLDAIVSALRDGHRNFSVLSSALQLLTLTGADLTAALIDLLDHSDADLRIQAALALGSQSGGAAVDALFHALDDEDLNVRFHAIESLGKLSPPSAVERLAEIAESHDFFLAFPALEALARISDAAVAPRLLPLLGDDLVGDQAAEALGQIGDEDAVAPLAAGLDRPGASVASIVDALCGIHARYAEMFSGGGEQIEELVRNAITPARASRVIEAAERSTGAPLRQFVTVLGWLRGDAVERALTHLLGKAGVQGELIEAIVRFGAPMVDCLIAQIDSDDADTRRAAVVALGRIGDGRAVAALVALLDDDVRDLLVPAAAALARLGDRRAFESLLRLLGDADPGVRQAAIGALNSIGHPEMAACMSVLLEDPDPRVRESAVRIAGYFGYASCADALLERCRDGDEAVRSAALEHAAYLDDERRTHLLVGALADDTPRARASAARALAYVDAPEARAALRLAVDDPDAWVRYFSVTSLGRQADQGSLPVLERMAVKDGAPQVRIAAVGAIGEVGLSSDGAAVPLLASLAEATDDELAVAAVRAMGSVDAPSAIDSLRRALSAARPARRSAAAEALGRRGGAQAVSLLQWTAAVDADPDVVRAALRALGRIGESAAPAAAAAIAAIATIAADPARRLDAIAALARVSARAIPHVGACLSSRDSAVRRAVIEALGRLTHPAASAYVASAMTDDDASVRQTAVTVLSRLGTRGVARSFVDIANSDPSEGVRRAAQAALRRIGKGAADATGSPDRP